MAGDAQANTGPAEAKAVMARPDGNVTNGQALSDMDGPSAKKDSSLQITESTERST
jgi:hypothetical protein